MTEFAALYTRLVARTARRISYPPQPHEVRSNGIYKCLTAHYGKIRIRNIFRGFQEQAFIVIQDGQTHPSNANLQPGYQPNERQGVFSKRDMPDTQNAYGRCLRSITGDNMQAKVMQIANLYPNSRYNNHNQGRIYSAKGISPCLHTCGGGNLEPKFLVICKPD